MQRNCMTGGGGGGGRKQGKHVKTLGLRLGLGLRLRLGSRKAFIITFSALFLYSCDAYLASVSASSRIPSHALSYQSTTLHKRHAQEKSQKHCI